MPFYHSGDVRLSYEERSARGELARTAVLVHGWCGSGSGWRPLMDALPDGYRAFAPDLRGTGASDRPADGYTIEQYAADVFALLVARDLHGIDLIGSSMGGAIALSLALDHPDRLRSLTLISPVPAEGLPHGGPDSADVRLAARTQRDAARWMSAAYHARPVSTEAVEQGAEALMSVSDGHYWQSLEAMERFDVSGRLGQLAVPTLIMGGDSDRVISLEALVRMRRAIPNCGLQVFWRVGHSPRAEAPEHFRAVLFEFLDSPIPA